MPFSGVTGVVMDMDGVLWRGDVVLPGAESWLRLLRAQGIPFVLATNNATKTPADYVAKFEQLGLLPVDERCFLTSGSTTADYLQRHFAPGSGVYVVGARALGALIERAGFVLADDAEIVVAGLDRELTYAKLRHATLLIRRGAAFIGTNPDKSFPSPEGLVPGAGSILAALAAATDRQPVIMGKPNLPMFATALTVLGSAPNLTLMVGDRLDTDIEGAARAGLRTALVLTGVSTRDDLEASSTQPDAVYDDLLALAEVFKT